MGNISTYADDLSAWFAPAKLNLFLHITGQRANGYHELQSIMVMLDQGDWLRFNILDTPQIARKNPHKDLPDNDLCVRAAQLLQAHCAIAKGVIIDLEKHLPMGAGLGGGSSNAATTLLALNDLWQCGLGKQALAELGLTLGADVPFFIFGQSAWMAGIGEILTAHPLAPKHYVVITPDVAVATAEIFASETLPRNHQPLDPDNYRADELGNDMTATTCARYPRVAQAMQWLENQLPANAHVRMSGSGASVFVEITDQQQADGLLTQLPAQWTGFTASSLATHPMNKNI